MLITNKHIISFIHVVKMVKILTLDFIKEILFSQRQSLIQSHDIEIERNYSFKEFLDEPEILVITGVRRCGKSSLVRQQIRLFTDKTQIFWLDFEDPRLRHFREEDFERAYQANLELFGYTKERKTIIVFDEIQEVENWERWATYYATMQNHKVIVTGSNAKMLSKEVSTVLTGRHRDISLSPLSFKEFVNSGIGLNLEQQQLLQSTRIPSPEWRSTLSTSFKVFQERGGFPRVALSGDTSLLANYFYDIISKDIVTRKKIRATEEILLLGELLANDNTRLINQEKLTKHLGLKERLTLAKFLKYFEETYLFSFIKKFDSSLRKRQRSQIKPYCVDPIMSQIVSGKSGKLFSDSLENIIFNELIRRGHTVFYWKSKKDWEVDFVVVKGTRPRYAIQVCEVITSPETQERETRALIAAKEELEVEKLILITKDSNTLPYLGSKDLSEIEVVGFAEWALEVPNSKYSL